MVKQGDIIWLDFSPQSGHEQANKRPALVISNSTLNTYNCFAIVCPITNSSKEYFTHYPLDSRTKTTGVIMCDQVKPLDVVARKYKKIECCPRDIVLEVLDIVQGLLDID